MALRTAVGGTPREGRRVLVVDDTRTMVRLLQVNLEKAGLEVTCAFDGVEALERIAEQEFHWVILDVMMPRLDGFEVLKKIRMNPETEDLRVILLTAKDQDEDVFKGYHYGADVYLTKPTDTQDIIRLIHLLQLGD